MKLDLRYGGTLNHKLSVLFNDIANRMRAPFTELVTKISESMENNLDWWLEGPASRNTQVSPFFYYYCSFHLVNELFNKKVGKIVFLILPAMKLLGFILNIVREKMQSFLFVVS